MPIDPKEEFKNLLRDLFQLDKTDLDFGIYRIMNLRANDVENFIDNELPAILKKVTDADECKSKAEAQASLEQATKELREFIKKSGENADSDDVFNAFVTKMPKAEPVRAYLGAKDAIATVSHSLDTEREVYNDLYRFFGRYYDEGDFITKPRAGDHTYMIPYNGEEVKFHWANRDQYYIKTGDNFRNYVFNNGEADEAVRVTVEFRLVDAETATNNNQNKKGRVFIPTEDYFEWNSDERKLTVRFYYRVPTDAEKAVWGDKQSVRSENKGINERLIFRSLDERIRDTSDVHLIRFWESQKTIKVKNKDEEISVFYFHLNRYTTTNSFDYFIHKDLRGFLLHELDYFLKNEIFSLNFISPDLPDDSRSRSITENLLRASAIRAIASAIIEFLAELENFQKMLFEKKKFVVQSDYCITLDLIPTDVKDEIIDYVLCDPKQKQLLEWQQLGVISSVDLDAKQIQTDNYLTLDTQFLSLGLKGKLLGGIENLDERCGGLLINSENFQALAFLLASYQGKATSVYIDPPYNTAASEIVYKNSYKHSTWIAMLQGRLELGKKMLSKDGVLCAAIDDFEFPHLRHLLDDAFGQENFLSVVVVRSNPHGRAMLSGFQQNHEYALFYGNSNSVAIGRLPRDERKQSRYPHVDDLGPFTWLNFRTTGANSRRIDRPKLYFPIYVSESGNIRFPDLEWSEEKRAWNSKTQPRKDETVIYPLDSNREERVWNLGRERVSTMAETDFLSKKIDGIWQIYRKYRPNEEGALPNTWWDDAKYSATDNGNRILRAMFGERENFSYPKSVFLVEDCLRAASSFKESVVFDFFAGSGTTGHAVINLNRGDDGTRKYVLIEMGEYFETVTKPRIQKVIYSSDWKGGKPVRPKEPLLKSEAGLSRGNSHIFQYIKLEQYEDSLNNIHFEDSAAPANLPFSDKIKYVLQKGTQDSTSLLPIEKLANPFDYEMEIIRLNERRTTKVDLVATFNFLLGLFVTRYRVFDHQERHYHVIHGKRGQQSVIVIWRHWTDALDMAEERDWITSQDWYANDAVVYTNADNAFKARGIEAEFKTLMFAETNI